MRSQTTVQSKIQVYLQRKVRDSKKPVLQVGCPGMHDGAESQEGVLHLQSEVHGPCL